MTFIKYFKGGGGTSYKMLGNSALASVSRAALKPTQPPVQWTLGVKHGWGMTLTTHLCLVPRSRMSRSYTSSSTCLLNGGSRTAFILYLHLYYYYYHHQHYYCHHNHQYYDYYF
jgi:hypothetical protein